MRKLGRCSVLAALISVLAACGGSGNIGTGTGTPTTPTTPTTPGPVTPTPTTPTVATVTLLADTTQLPSDASTVDKGVDLTATVIDSANNIVVGATVQFAVDNQGVLTVTQATTDASGNAFATLTTPTSKANRVLNVSATSSGVSGSLIVNVVGTTLGATGPDSLAAGQTATYTVVLLDASGRGIGGQAVTVSTASGSTLSASSLTTDSATGQATVSVTAASAASETLTFAALGLTATKAITISNDQFRIVSPAAGAELPINASSTVTVEWLRGGSAAETAGRTVSVSSTRGTLSATSANLDGSGRASFQLSSSNAGGVLIEATSNALTRPTASTTAEFIATSADAVDVQFSPAVIPTNSQSSVTATVRDTAGNLVKNTRINFTLQDVTNGSLSAGSGITNSQGQATVLYRSTSTQSSNAGVRVTATAASSGANGQATLTVGGGALRVVLGTGNEITEKNTTQYLLPYSVIVTDSAGNPATSAQVRLELLSVSYGKGSYQAVDTDADGTPDRWGIVNAVGCANEDADLDGVLDNGEDFNANQKLEPGNVASLPSTVTLESDGSAQFQITYPQDHANWVTVRLRGTANVSGTEAFEEATFTLPVLASDVSDLEVSPPGADSPYGTVLDCSSAN